MEGGLGEVVKVLCVFVEEVAYASCRAIVPMVFMLLPCPWCGTGASYQIAHLSRDP